MSRPLKPRRYTRPGNRSRFPVTPLRRGSHPTETPEVHFVDAIDRRFDCSRYSNCLDHAAGAKWGGWSCEACPVREPKSPSEMQDELDGLADFLCELSGPRAVHLRLGYFFGLRAVSGKGRQ
jgi:hypothetical protein